MLLVVWLFCAFFKMTSRRACLSFIGAAVLLFHSHPYGIAPTLALGGLSLVYRPFASQRRWIWFAAPTIGILTLPWRAFFVFIHRICSEYDCAAVDWRTC